MRSGSRIRHDENKGYHKQLIRSCEKPLFSRIGAVFPFRKLAPAGPGTRSQELGGGGEYSSHAKTKRGFRDLVALIPISFSRCWAPFLGVGGKRKLGDASVPGRIENLRHVQTKVSQRFSRLTRLNRKLRRRESEVRSSPYCIAYQPVNDYRLFSWCKVCCELRVTSSSQAKC